MKSRTLLAVACIFAGIQATAGVINTTISPAAATTNAVTDFFDIGDRVQTVRQIESVEFYLTLPSTNIVALVELRQETGTALTNTLTSATLTGKTTGVAASLLYPRRTTTALASSGAVTNAVQHVEFYAVNRAKLIYSFAAATNTAVAVGCPSGTTLQYIILTR